MEQDFERIRAAMEALEAAYDEVFRGARVGMSAEEIDRLLARALAARGAELLPSGISPYVVAPEGAPPKLRLNRVALRRGALWAMDNNIRRDGVYADLGRYGWFGPLPEALAAKHRRVLRRQDDLAAAVRPGLRMADLFAACPHDMPFEIHRIGARQTMLPVCGNATPKLADGLAESDRQGLTFQPGDVICIEIWAGLDGGIEDMYRVEERGVVRISTLPREIRILPED